MRALRRLGGAQDGGLLVADPPIPRRDERALPHAGLDVARGLLVLVIVVAEPHIGQRPSVSHHPFLDVLAVDFASRHNSPAAVGSLVGVAGPALVVGMLDEFVAGRSPAGPALALAVQAKLIDRRRIDAAETNPAGSDHDGIALANLRGAGDVGGLHRNRQAQRKCREQEFQAHVTKARSKWKITMGVDCDADLAGTLAD